LFPKNEYFAFLSWDWGPAFPSVGIWRPISIEAYNTAILKYVKWEPYFIDGTWSIGVNPAIQFYDNWQKS
jgi:hypothetical protein